MAISAIEVGRRHFIHAARHAEAGILRNENPYGKRIWFLHFIIWNGHPLLSHNFFATNVQLKKKDFPNIFTTTSQHPLDTTIYLPPVIKELVDRKRAPTLQS